MIDSNREEFEKLPEIKKRIASGVYWNESIKMYRQNGGSCRGATFVNGAWYAYQEQQKKLDCCREENMAHLEKIDELQGRIDAIHDIIKKAKKSKSGNYLINEIDTVLEGNKDEN